MATFLTTTDSSAAIERVIRSAKNELTLISAYVYPRVIYLSRLRDAAARGVKITLIFGKQKMDDRVMELFKEVDNLSIYYLDVLHAKCFVNENEAIVTSLNLLNGSEVKNREMGVRLDRTQDAEAYAECVSEVKSILNDATLMHTSRGTARATKEQALLPANGFCIRCGENLPCNPDRPLCYADFKVWVQDQDVDFVEHNCHTCGESNEVSMAKPLCRTCFKKYKKELVRLDADRENAFQQRTWRDPVTGDR